MTSDTLPMSVKVDAQAFPIRHVSLYVSGRAELEREIKVTEVQPGSCDLTIERLPTRLDHDSLRIEGSSIGAGSVTIHDVAIKDAPTQTIETSETLHALRRQLDVKQNALQRATLSVQALEGFLKTLDAEHVDIGSVGEALAGYETQADKLQSRVNELNREISSLYDAIHGEEMKQDGGGRDDALTTIAVVSLAIEADGPIELELKLRYALNGASWTPKYDIRVTTDGETSSKAADASAIEAKAVKLTFKASITQNTGEPWESTALTLETSQPTVGRDPPKLRPWELSVFRPMPKRRESGGSSLFGAEEASMPRTRSAMPKMALMSAPAPAGAFAAARPPPPPAPVAAVQASASVSSTGQATSFVVPGRVSIPNGGSHSVGVSVLELPAQLVRTCIPRLETTVHLEASIRNDSAFTLLPGKASVYLDGTFVATSRIKNVSTGDRFGCQLGTDHALRVVYTLKPRKSTTSGLVSRTRTTTCQAAISVVNTSSTRFVPSLRIFDHVPVSTDDKIGVKLISPSLPPIDTLDQDAPHTWTRLARTDKATASVRWANADDASSEPGEAGDASVNKQGKIEWDVSLAPQGKINIGLQFEVSAPADITVAGM